MPTTFGTPATATDLLARVSPFGPSVDREELVFGTRPPAELLPLLRIHHTGIRALLAGKLWYGCNGATGRVSELNPSARIPAGVTLLCVAGDQRWDRIDSRDRASHPWLFSAEKPQTRRAASG